MKWAAFRKRVWRGLVTVLAVPILLVGAGIIYQTSASAKARETYAAPGNLIPVNGSEMHLHCIGEGSPTVILETGVGGNTLLWGRFSPSLRRPRGSVHMIGRVMAGVRWLPMSEQHRKWLKNCTRCSSRLALSRPIS